ncbi:MAG TPA: hypothetical protein VFD57_02320, partial [Clostridia bacterium]|nr:hypothetical protein [Clostridia bacterium]
KLSLREDEEPKVLCDQIRSLDSPINKKLYLKIADGRKLDIPGEISPILKRFKGDIPVILYIESSKEKRLAGRELWIKDNPILITELSQLLGAECVKMV